MSTIIRTWIAFAAIGTGLIHLALVIGAPVPLGIVLGTLGFVEFAWGVLAFARETLLLPRVALVFAVVPVLLWALLLVISSVAQVPQLAASLPFVPFAVATVFELFIAGALAVHLRRPTDSAPSMPSAGRYAIALVGGALVVAALTAPALASTQVVDLGNQPGFEFEDPDHETGH